VKPNGTFLFNSNNCPRRKAISHQQSGPIMRTQNDKQVKTNENNNSNGTTGGGKKYENGMEIATVKAESAG